MARNSIILNGKSSDTITGLIIQELPPISKPLMRSQVEEIDGRDGDIITKLGFSAYDKEISVGLYGNFDINEIIAYFNSEGTVTFSNEPDKFYYYQILEQIDFERLVRFRTATINFHVQPFKYSTTEEAETIEAGTVSGEGNNLVLENTSDNPFSKLTPKGDTYQQTYTGKNLLNPVGLDAKVFSGTINNGYYYNADLNYVVEAGKTYTLSVQMDAVSVTPYQFLVLLGDSAPRGGVATVNNLTTIGGRIYATFTPTQANIESYGNRLFMRVPRYGTPTTFTYSLSNIQLELNSTMTDYEPYTGGLPSPNPEFPQNIQVVTGEQTIKVTGKNLADIIQTAQVNNGITSTRNGGEVTLTGTATATSVCQLTDYFKCEAGKTYTISANNPVANSNVILRLYRSGGSTRAVVLSSVNASQSTTFTEDETVRLEVRVASGTAFSSAFSFKPQLELGSTATTYEPYQSQSYTIDLGSTELCGIGKKPDGTYTYQDYIWKDGADWKVHKIVGKRVLDGSEAWSGGAYGSCYRYNTNFADALEVATVASYVGESDHFYFDTDVFNSANIKVGMFGQYIKQNDANSVYFASAETSASNFKTWLGTHNTTVYYPLATPTDTAIADETLLGQLDDLAAAHAYKGRTHIISTAGSDANLPHIIEAEVLGSSDTTITNAGNFISKPKFTIYGSGNIGLYINGIQILQIALGDEQYITIDAAQMEAYKDTLDNLKNRLVTGDYTNLALNPGENQISFSGQVEKYIVENYSRWL